MKIKSDHDDGLRKTRSSREGLSQVDQRAFQVVSRQNPCVIANTTSSPNGTKIKKKQIPEKIDLKILNNNEVKEKLKTEINENLHIIEKLSKVNAENINKTWTSIKDVVVTPSLKHQKETKRRRKDWMAEEILKDMDTRRQYKNNTEKYKEIQMEIRQKSERPEN
ncbi:hypothetical protein ILUMI_20869 [Ignelater luminosus]|uniref:Uncharacterized protein n=1 Tax=Ignelater luminosus TaxID=2038154 RepID=A0A8K0CIV9_IGNLU|nr:hypothetical protein ILUMI_20869 [Ignelater luminosus]